MTTENKIRLSIGTALTIITMLIMAVGSFYGSQAESKAYTDTKVEAVEKDSKTDHQCLTEKMTKIEVDVGVIKAIVIDKLGKQK